MVCGAHTNSLPQQTSARCHFSILTVSFSDKELGNGGCFGEPTTGLICPPAYSIHQLELDR